VVCLLAAACGGGGGGNGNGNGNGGGSPPGAVSELLIDQLRAPDALNLALQDNEFISFVNWGLLSAAYEGDANGLMTIVNSCFGAGGTYGLAFVDSDADMLISAGDSITVTHDNCDETSGTEILELTTVDRVGGIAGFTGRVRYELEFWSAGSLLARASGSHLFVFSFPVPDYELESTDVQLTVSGFFTERIIDGTLIESYDGSGGYRITLAGTADSTNLGGRFTYRTQPYLEGSLEQVPSSGYFYVEGRNGSAARISTSDVALATVLFELDSVGNGQFLAFTENWTAFSDGGLFGFSYGALGGDNVWIPEMTDLSISPARPAVGDDLVAVFAYRDLDGNPLTITYEWSINGALVTSATGDTLSAELLEEGDQVTLVVRISDGLHETSDQASTTIQRADFLLTTAQPLQPRSGELLTFPLSISDRQGNTVAPQAGLRFELVYGPAGMSVDAGTGIVTWLPKIPLFEPETLVNWSVRSTDHGIEPIVGSFVLSDPDRAQPRMWTGMELPRDNHLQVGDFDGDGEEELLMLSESYLAEYRWDGTAYVQHWAYPFDHKPSPRMTAMRVIDTDGDGIHEIFACAGNRIVKLGSVGRRFLGTYDVPDASAACDGIEVADIDNDARLEIVVLVNNSIYVLREDTGQVLWDSQDINMFALAVGNVDGDPALEIVTGNGHVFDGSTATLQWSYDEPGFGYAVAIADIDSDGIGEIIAEAFDRALRVFRATTQDVLAEIPEVFGFYENALSLENLEGDATPEILTGGADGSARAYTFDASSASLNPIFDVATPFDTLAGIGVGDPDGDGNREFVLAGLKVESHERLAVAERDSELTIEWTNSAASLLNGPYVGGDMMRSGVAAPRLAFTSMFNYFVNGPQVIAVSPQTLMADIGDVVAVGFSSIVAATVADYDGDSIDEILMAVRASQGAQVLAYDFDAAAAEWSSAQPTGDPAAVAAADLTDDGHRELIVAGGNPHHLGIYDVFAQVPLFQTTTPDYLVDVAAFPSLPSRIVVAQLTSVDLYTGNASATSFTTQPIFSISNGDGSVRDLEIGDIDDDGNYELLLLVGRRSMPSQLRIYDENLILRRAFDVSPIANTVFIEELGYARKNIALGLEADFSGGGEIAIIDAVTGAEIMRSPSFATSISRNSLHYVDPDGDGEFAISFATKNGMFLTR
jgi:hypothetical protein